MFSYLDTRFIKHRQGFHSGIAKSEKAEGVGFEPTVPKIETAVFKTATLSLSVTPPTFRTTRYALFVLCARLFYLEVGFINHG